MNRPHPAVIAIACGLAAAIIYYGILLALSLHAWKLEG